MAPTPNPPLPLPPPYHSLPHLLLHHRRLPRRRLVLAAHALAAVAGHLSVPGPPHTTLLLAYSRHLASWPRAPLHLLLLFRTSLRLSVPPTRHTLPLAVSAAAASSWSLPLALSLHALAVTRNLLPFTHVSNALVSLYARSALPDSARRVFDGMPAPDVVSHNALVHGYVKAGRLGHAMRAFEGMPERDAVSWGTVVAGFAKAGRLEEAVRLFDRMRREGFRPDDVALAAVLSCCAQLGALDKGQEVHDYVRRSRPRPNVFLCTGIVDLYAKCGRVDVAREVFDACPEKNVFTWNALVVGLAMHGHGTVALDYFDRMLVEGFRPDGTTFLGVLIGCSHAGLVDTARRIFCEMQYKHRVPRELKHYGCMADLLGRAGLIDEAMEMISNMPMEADTYVWGGILAGCRMHGNNVEFAEVAARRLLELNPDDGGVYSVMAGIYADAGRWEDVARVRRLMDERIGKRNVGWSSITMELKDGIKMLS